MLNELLNRYPSLFACKETIQQAAEALIRCYADGKKVMA
jgi:phosphoheptose isomerase